MTYRRLTLNGEWHLQPGGRPSEQFRHRVPVPALVDVAKPVINDWQKFDYFWYRKEFELPQSSDFAHAYLQMEQVQFGTEVWLNDELVGGDIPCYTSQWFALTGYLRKEAKNVLLVRVGAKRTLPSHSAVGNDFEKLSWIPGIWGDVSLHLYGNGRVHWTQILPDIEEGKITICSEIENLSRQKRQFEVAYRVLEKNSGRQVAQISPQSISVTGNKMVILANEITIPDCQLWSPESPFLYALEVVLNEDGDVSHQESIAFGMRQFEIRKGHFYLNGHRRVLKGSNIAFHRMLSDPTRGVLPWQTDWIKKALVDIPRAHNMFYFRLHLGHAYNRWYDLADEHGVLLQDEWAFWTSSGTPEQIEKEFRAWVRENCNHPSIVLWDALNESTDKAITEDIIPRLKTLDPSRPWQPVDFVEDHPYIYSLGPVLNDRRFGFSRSISDLENSKTPAMVNEFVWWWLDRENAPTSLTKMVVERWLGRKPSAGQLVRHQGFLLAELVELWRRLNLDAIMPFVYLSAGEGATANWFCGSLQELQPKPVLDVCKNAFSPVGVSVELWDRHFQKQEKRRLNVYLFNDTTSAHNVTLFLTFNGEKRYCVFEQNARLPAEQHTVLPVVCQFPEQAGHYTLRAEIAERNGGVTAFSEKPVFVFADIEIPPARELPKLTLHDPGGEIARYLEKNTIPFETDLSNLQNTQVVLINTGAAAQHAVSEHVAALTDFVADGGILILQEPELGVDTETQLTVLEGLNLNIRYREDTERGGYDSCVIPENPHHFLWQSIAPEHLTMFNGGLGGEMVSQHSVRPNVPFERVASCNLGLKTPAVMEIPYGAGWVIVSRVQIRGRLLTTGSSDNLYERRYDPVAERYFWNLVAGYVNRAAYQQKVKSDLIMNHVYIALVRTSTGDIYEPVAGIINTAWYSITAPSDWIWIDLGRPTQIRKLSLRWQTPHYKEFRVLSSQDDGDWQLLHHGSNSDCSRVTVSFSKLVTRYLRIDFKKRESKFSNTIWEMSLE